MPMSEDALRPRKRGFRWWYVPLIVLLAIAISFLFPWKLNFLRGTIAEKVSESAHRSFSVDGDIWLYWLQGPRLTVDGLRLGNPAWAATPQMVTVDRVDTTISLGDLLHKRFVLPTLVVTKPVINLEQAADGKKNWLFDAQQSDPDSKLDLVIERIALDQGHIGYLAKGEDTDVQVDLAPIAASEITAAGTGSTNGIGAKATGRYKGQKLTAEAKAGDVFALKDKDTPFPFDVKATIGPNRVTAVGTITDPASLKAADLKVSIAGQNVADWYKLTGIALPPTPPYRTAGRVVIANGVYRYDDFTGQVGNSDLSGSLAFEKRPARPYLSGNLVSKNLDLKDLEPAIGKSPKPDKPPVEEEDKRTPVKRDKLLPQQTFDTSKWDSLDADVTFKGQSIKNVGEIPFDNLDMHIVLADRVLTLQPLSFGFAGGYMGGNFRFDGSGVPMHATVDAKFTDLELSKLQPKLTDNSAAALGRLNGAVKLDGRGNSIAAMLATSNGSAQIGMGRGRSSSLLLEAVGLQGPQVVRYLLGDRDSKIECLMVDFGIDKGNAVTRPSLLDTDLNVVTLEGNADFKDESMKFRLTPLPKHKSIIVLRTPFDIDGTFANPSVRPDFTVLGLRVGGAIGLGFINPLLSLLPLIETGPGEDTNCAALLEQLKNAPVKNTDTRAEEKDKAKPKKAPAKKAKPATVAAAG